MTSDADAIIGLYERHAHAWDRNRGGELILEKHWMDRFAAQLPAGGSVLDIGCGTGQPIARHLRERGFAVTGIDASPTLIATCRDRFAHGQWLVADMRTLSLQRRFNGLIAWDSLFHLSYDDQRAMFAIFREHAADDAVLVFTSGTEHGIAIGSFEGEPLFHASLSTMEYRALLEAHGFAVLHHEIEDPECGGHTIWLARLGY